MSVLAVDEQGSQPVMQYHLCTSKRQMQKCNGPCEDAKVAPCSSTSISHLAPSRYLQEGSHREGLCVIKEGAQTLNIGPIHELLRDLASLGVRCDLRSAAKFEHSTVAWYWPPLAAFKKKGLKKEIKRHEISKAKEKDVFIMFKD